MFCMGSHAGVRVDGCGVALGVMWTEYPGGKGFVIAYVAQLAIIKHAQTEMYNWKVQFLLPFIFNTRAPYSLILH